MSAPFKPAPALGGRPLWLGRLRRIGKSWDVRRRLAKASQYAALPQVISAEPSSPSRPPVFVLSAGWRSGSTAVQRLIVSGGSAYVWGEPFPTCKLLGRLDRIARESLTVDAQPDRVVTTTDISADTWDSWLATTNPSAGSLLQGIRALLQETYWGPLRETGFETWGAKEVVLAPRHIELLTRLFPEARFVCIVRDPTAAYASFRRFVVSGVSVRDRPSSALRWVKGPMGYGRVWAQMAATFRGFENDPRFLVFRYEEIAGSPAFPKTLGDSLEMELDPRAWSTKVGSVGEHAVSFLARAELAALRRICRNEASAWGYEL